MKNLTNSSLPHCERPTRQSCNPTRRGFLAAAGAALALAAGRGFARPSRHVVVGGHVWVYAAPQPGYDPTPVLPEAFADMKYAGLDGIEVMHLCLRHADAVERIGELAEKHALAVIGTSYSADMWNREKHSEILADAETVISRLAKLGGKTFGATSNRARGVKTPEQLDAQAEMLRKLIRLCDSNGITLNVHNHTWEVENDEYELRENLRRVPELKLGPDLNWLVRGGADPADFIRRHGERIVFLHLRNQYANGKWSESLAEGDMDYAAIGRALEEINFSGHAMIELAHEGGFKPTRPLRESWKMSREFVRKTLGF
jgi:sugar phosphate isomerase/epimerase